MMNEQEQLHQLLTSHFWVNETTIDLSLAMSGSASFHVFSDAANHIHRWQAIWADGTKEESARSFPTIKHAKEDLEKRVRNRICELHPDAKSTFGP